MLNPRIGIFFGALLCYLAGGSFSFAVMAEPIQQEITVVIGNDFDKQSLGRGIAVYINEDAGLTRKDPLDILSQEQWQHSEQGSLSFGFATAPTWLLFRIRNAAATTQDLLVEIANPYLDYIDVYQISEQNTLTSHSMLGDKYPAIDRPILHANFLAPVILKPGEDSRILIRVETSSTNRIPITLWDTQHFISADYHRTLLQSILYGIFIGISAYYLLLFLYIQEKAYIYWSSSILGILFIVLSLDGAATAILWPGNTVLSDHFIILGICGTSATSALFGKEVLNLKERPVLNLSMNAMLVASLLLLLASFFAPYQTILKLALALALINAVAQIVVYLIRLFDNYEPARYVVIAIMLICLGIIVNILTVSGKLPATVVSVNALSICATFSVLFYSLALSNRMNLDRALRKRAQVKLASDLQIKVHDRTNALQEAHEQLLILSRTDGLTGLLNRHHFDEVFDAEYRSAYRKQQPIAVLMLDVDHFKRLNDHYGHQFGDHCIRFIAKQISACLSRPPDICARYGGEEFIVVLPNTQLDGAVGLAETIRSNIAESLVSEQNVSASITISIGVASTTPTELNQQGKLLQEADEYLYRAKQQGRNQVGHV